MQIAVEPAQALKRKYPEQVVLVTTRAADGCANVMAVGWVAIASGDPLMFVLGIDAEAYSFRLIRETRQFVLAMPSEAMAQAVLKAGAYHGRPGCDKLKEIGLVEQPAVKLRAPLLRDAVANFECELAEIFQPGDCPLVIGRVTAAHVHQDVAVRRLYTIGPGHLMGAVAVTPLAAPEKMRQR